ncbi:MAG: DNA-binding response regulator [Candidatus Nephthysia bennettiae]|uniref:Response regulator transcription factor n=1 Tax=Candidatus Nephthysia bennettiae TaxID=3127016 RepID=A0A934K7J1_9BACT|nr:response regulator transcription factor [Candidatus Dormibacteraeota bacterium]MBJ7612451.1 response regulator transcription factor [Candidatus Dormibacteraeota bacterium]PZR85065.1 MAG: DNA-binding response regulator [Candidatus Dormibacteraeota bacterium]
MRPRVLVVEDNGALRTAISEILDRGGYDVEEAVDGAAGVTALSRGAYEVVLLDIGLPFVDGWKILEGLAPGRLPSVIVISARGEERDKVRALDLGADDYLAKPFGADELLARLRAVLRRASPASVASPAVRLGDVVIDLSRRSVLKGEEEVKLSPTEYGLLAYLARQAGSVVDHRTLLREVWGPSHVHERNYLWTFVQRLRRKLEDDPRDPRLIVSAGSRGYRLGPPVTGEEAPPSVR